MEPNGTAIHLAVDASLKFVDMGAEKRLHSHTKYFSYDYLLVKLSDQDIGEVPLIGVSAVRPCGACSCHPWPGAMGELTVRNHFPELALFAPMVTSCHGNEADCLLPVYPIPLDF